MNWIPDSTRARLIRKPIPLYLCRFCGFKWNSFRTPENCPACGRSGHVKLIRGKPDDEGSF